ncbi:ABC transporter permease [Nocardioides sp.]|uniref:ABC transporter permease n=1 Tax=Nocardioides sp. TaxID=35761 RepID=UPI0035173699
MSAVASPTLRRRPSPWHLLDYWLITLRRTWRSAAITALVMPALFIGAFGLVLGDLVDARSGPASLEGASSYLLFVGPGLLASQVMLNVFSEATWPVKGMVVWQRSYVAMAATPLRVRDIVVAHLAAIAAKTALVSAGSVVVLRLGGAVDSWGSAALLVPVQVLLALAFAGVVHAVTVATLSDAVITLLWRIVSTPLFLFSGAFFPIANLPGALEVAARLTPLWHGVDLSRTIALGTADTRGVVVHLAFLAVWAVAGAVLAVRALDRRLVR